MYIYCIYISMSKKMTQQEFDELLFANVAPYINTHFNDSDEQKEKMIKALTSTEPLPSLLNFKSKEGQKLGIYIDESNDELKETNSEYEKLKSYYESLEQEMETALKINLGIESEVINSDISNSMLSGSNSMKDGSNKSKLRHLSKLNEVKRN